MHPLHHRTYTLAFKLQVIRACLEEHQAVRAVARQFAVDHSLVRYWVRLYDGGGEPALQDRRGHPNPRPPRRLSPDLALAEENAWLKAENAYLKILWARERGDGVKAGLDSPKIAGITFPVSAAVKPPRGREHFPTQPVVEIPEAGRREVPGEGRLGSGVRYGPEAGRGGVGRDPESVPGGPHNGRGGGFGRADRERCAAGGPRPSPAPPAPRR